MEEAGKLSVVVAAAVAVGDVQLPQSVELSQESDADAVGSFAFEKSVESGVQAGHQM